MTLFGKSLRDYLVFTRVGIALILLMGMARFLVGLSGIPYDKVTHLLSLTILTSLLSLLYGQKAAQTGFGRYRRLLPAVFMFSVTMYGFIVAAILVQGLSGIHGYFHSPGSGMMPMNMQSHIGGQQIAMLPTPRSWLNVANPFVHALGQLIAMPGSTLFFWGLASLGFLLSRYLGYLRNAFLLLAAMAVLRFLVGAAGVPYAIGTWITSLTLLAIVLTVYYGYRAPSKGFTRYHQMFVIGTLIAAGTTLLVIYGIAVTTGLGIPNYFHAPGEGFMPQGMSISRHILGHIEFSMPAMLLASLLACIGLFLGKRLSPAPAGQAA